MFEQLKRGLPAEQDLPATAGSYSEKGVASGFSRKIESLPGFFARRRRNLPPSEESVARIPSGAVVDTRKSA